MKTVIVAEKPNQAKLYAEAFEVVKREQTHIELKACHTFPAGAVITWGIGHLVEIALPGEHDEKWANWNLQNLPVAPAQYKLKVADSKKAQFNAVKKLLQDADIIINGCDIDREGSNIFYLILRQAGIKGKTIKRLWINSLEIDEIRKGFMQLRDNQQDILMYQEAHARQIADWLVGMNGSPLFSLLLQQQGLRESLSVGRCQSPLVMMIYDREQQIKNFASKPFYELVGTFTTSNQGTYKGKAKLKLDSRDELNHFLLENKLPPGVPVFSQVTSVEKKEKRTQSPRLHSLSTLQAVANKKWKYSPKAVLDVMQSLYESKILTYPRTDSNFITEAEFAYLADKVEAYQELLGVKFEANKTANKRYVDNTKVQEHFAIIPTKTVPDSKKLEQLSAAERNIYEEVLRTTLAMFHGDYKYEETKIVTTVNSIEFFTTGKVELDLGWKALFSQAQMKEESEKASEDENSVLPSVNQNESVIGNIHEKEGFTTPPKPFTEGQLIDLMKTAGKTIENEEDAAILKEVEGIGTEATRSNIIETVKQKGYIAVNKNIVSVTSKGEVLCQALANTLVGSPMLTAKWESKLRLIGEGKLSLESFVADINTFIVEMINEANTTIAGNVNIQTAINKNQAQSELGSCPVCKKGKMIDRGSFVGCDQYKEGCKFSISRLICKKKITDKAVQDLIVKQKTGIIKGFISSKNTKFEAMLVVKEGKVQFEFAKK